MARISLTDEQIFLIEEALDFILHFSGTDYRDDKSEIEELHKRFAKRVEKIQPGYLSETDGIA